MVDVVFVERAADGDADADHGDGLLGAGPDDNGDRHFEMVAACEFGDIEAAFNAKCGGT